MRAAQLENEKFGRLKVISETEPRISPKGRRDRMWKCVCDCGNVVSVSASHLLSGHTKSCGCLQRERASESSAIDLSGNVFGKLKVIERISEIGEKARYKCVCECGNIIEVLGCNLVKGTTKSCGCIRKEVTGKLKYKHGLHETRLYQTWENMKSRCYNKKNSHYNRYGGRGITICDEWLEDFTNFYNWAMESGYKDNLTIDRIDNDGNYCPENCQWITFSENSAKRNVDYWKNKKRLLQYAG